MHRLILLVAVVTLGACAARVAPDAGFRDRQAPIFSIAALDPSRLQGTWVQAAGFRAAGAGPCAGGAKIGPAGEVDLRLCLAQGAEVARGRLVPAGPGRLVLRGAGGALAQTWWVVWVDEGYRTLAIGTPSGDWGLVLNRGGPLPDDRLQAAATIFDFNGYDTARLVRLP